MKSFEYARPLVVADACALLSKNWGETEVIAGGTDLVTCMKQGIIQPKRVVSIARIGELRKIAEEGGVLQIGAGATLREALEHPAVRTHFPALSTAIRGIGSAQMIAVGTVGGDLCQRPRCWYYRTGHGLFGKENGRSLVRDGDNRYHAIFGNDGDALYVHPSSLAPALIALGGAVVVEGPNKAEREVPAGEFFQIPKSDTDRETVLAPNEVLTAVRIPMAGLKNATYEVRHRFGLDWPYVSASVAFAGDAGAASEVRVVLGHVAPIPWNAPNAAKAVEGGAIDSARALAAGDAAAAGASPLSRNGYKVQLVRTAVKRALLAAAGA